MRGGYLIGVVIALAGCALPEDVESAREALLTSNGLSTNALTKNSLTRNALSANALVSNALTRAVLSSVPALRDVFMDPTQGADAAMLVKYAARCMLRADQSITVDYLDSHGRKRSDTFFGNLGLQPGWATQGLSDADARWLGACLAAHVNAQGQEVTISVVSPNHPAIALRDGVPFVADEGSFFATYDRGSSSSPFKFYACYDYKVQDPLGSAFKKRTCSTGDVDCGITVVGQCDWWTTNGPGACELPVSLGPPLYGAPAACHTNLCSPSYSSKGGATCPFSGGQTSHEIITVILETNGGNGGGGGSGGGGTGR
jgi:hypothetical protein